MTLFEDLLTLSTPSLEELVRKGQGLMIPLILLALLSATIVVDRVLFWLGTLLRHVRENRLLQAYVDSDYLFGFRKYLEDHLPKERLGRLFRRNLYLDVLLAFEDHPGKEEKWQEKKEEILTRSERFLSFLTLIATLGTSFGLLGTVIGVSKSLKFIESDFSATVSGLSVALYTTIGGLLISIFSLTAYGILTSLSDGLGRHINLRVEKLRKREEKKDVPAPPKPPPPPGRGGPPGKAGGTPPREDTLAFTPEDHSQSDIVIEDL
jgi:biopolymer transport protein ExbB/TolQ